MRTTIFKFGVTIVTVMTLALLFASYLSAATTRIVFEAEDTTVSGKAFKILKYIEDPSRYVSGKKVLALDKLPAGEKVEKDSVTYKVNIPASGTYYLWGRTYWASGCGNSFFIKLQGYETADWTIGGDATYDTLHWVCLSDGGANKPRALKLKKGTATITLGARESGARADQFLLTTDQKFLPAGIYAPTIKALVK